MTTLLRPVRTRSARRARAVPAVFAPALFLLTVTLLSAADRAALGTWGWTPLDHHGVPWPSSLALLPGGWLQTAAFAGTGAALIALATAVSRGARALALGACGAGLLAAAFPLDLPVGDPAEISSWIHSWPAVVHAGGFAVAGLAGLVAVAASRRRRDIGLAALLALAAALGGAPGWYAFLAGVFGWITAVAAGVVAGAAGRTAGDPDHGARTAARGRAPAPGPDGRAVCRSSPSRRLPIPLGVSTVGAWTSPRANSPTSSSASGASRVRSAASSA